MIRCSIHTITPTTRTIVRDKGKQWWEEIRENTFDPFCSQKLACFPTTLSARHHHHNLKISRFRVSHLHCHAYLKGLKWTTTTSRIRLYCRITNKQRQCLHEDSDTIESLLCWLVWEEKCSLGFWSGPNKGHESSDCGLSSSPRLTVVWFDLVVVVVVRNQPPTLPYHQTDYHHDGLCLLYCDEDERRTKKGRLWSAVQQNSSSSLLWIIKTCGTCK